MSLTITATYAAALSVILLVLIYHVIFGRAKADVSILHGGDMALATRIRRHGNFVEIVPMALVVLGLAELGGANTTALHVSGLMLLVGRILQPFGMDPEVAAKPARIIGGLLSHLSIALSAVLIVLNVIG